jgi:hypothetical protein
VKSAQQIETFRQARSLIKSARNSLVVAERSWTRFVQVVEMLAAFHDHAELGELGPKARGIAQKMQECGEVLRSWTEE